MSRMSIIISVLLPLYDYANEIFIQTFYIYILLPVIDYLKNFNYKKNMIEGRKKLF